MFGIFASIRINPDKRDDFLATIKDTALRSVRDEPGCLRFDVFEDLADEIRYLLYEVYTDEAAFQEPLDTPDAQRAMEGSQECGEGPFEVTRGASIYPNSEKNFGALISGDLRTVAYCPTGKT